MASEWTSRPLRDCAAWYSGGTPSKGNPEYWNGSIPWISAKSLKEFFVCDSEDKVTEIGAENGTRLVPENTILFIVRGMSLKTEFRMGITTRPVTFNQDLKALVALNDILPAFLAYAIKGRTQEILSFVGEAGHGTGVLPTDRIQGLEISLPPVDEQRAISHILGTLDDKIELNRKQNKTLEAMARTLFKAWFVDFEPVRAKLEGRWQRGQSLPGLPAHLYDLFPDRLVESELGEIPEGWFPSTLGSELKKVNGLIQTGPFGSQLHASDYSLHGVPVVMPKNLEHRRVSTASVARVPAERAKPLARHYLRAGDIVYSRRGDVEKFAVISERETGWLCGTGCLLVRPGPNWKSTAFLVETLDYPLSREWIVRHAIGATMPNLNTEIIGKIPLQMPTEPALTAFERQCAPLQKNKEEANSENDILAELRDTLLPKLISGELRIRDAERIIGAAV